MQSYSQRLDCMVIRTYAHPHTNQSGMNQAGTVSEPAMQPRGMNETEVVVVFGKARRQRTDEQFPCRAISVRAKNELLA